METPDLLIVGAGPVGCVVAERAATQLGWKCLVVEKRPHIAGNCFDVLHESGLLIHQYGPHYFRTNSKDLIDYLSKFTEWVQGNYIVKSSVNGQLFPFPINLDTLEQFFGKPLDEETGKALIEQLRETISNPANSEEFVLSRVGRQLYEAFYLHYTVKQWAMHPRDLDPSVCGRIPLRFNRDNCYVDHQYQLTPAKGFTHLFGNMLNQPNIQVKLNCDFQSIKESIRPKRATIYCGTPDSYFDYRLGRLPWRSLEFDFKVVDQEFVQPCVQINHPNEHAYTRTVEIKHVTQQQHAKTVVSYEYPTGAGEPYYPIPSPDAHALYRQYAALADAEQREKRVYFAGRLARYVYVNTDQAIEMALNTFEAVRGLSPW